MSTSLISFTVRKIRKKKDISIHIIIYTNILQHIVDTACTRITENNMSDKHCQLW